MNGQKVIWQFFRQGRLDLLKLSKLSLCVAAFVSRRNPHGS